MSTGALKGLQGKIRVQDGKCPNGHSLMSEDKTFDEEKAVVVNVSHQGNRGTLYLNPFYGKFEYECDLSLKEGDVLDLTCPECGASLAIEENCKLCNIPMFAVLLPDGGQVEACPKVGCHNHSLTIVNLDEQLARMYVDETKYQM